MNGKKNCAKKYAASRNYGSKKNETQVIMKNSILFNWDEEAGVWTATSDDVPGLVLEADSYDELVEKLKVAIPELAELNKLSQRKGNDEND